MSHIDQHWSLITIALSYVISVTGSFCTIQLMEQWRQYEAAWTKRLLLALSAFTLGGCGIWCTHFTGMNALGLALQDGTMLEINYEPLMTFVSFVFPVLGVWIGLRIASRDPFFLEVVASRRKALLVDGMSKTKMKDMVKKDKVVKQIKFAALFSRLWYILIGGVFAALGVLGMHYLGMWAQRSNAVMSIHLGVVIVSCGIALTTAVAAFWILFRVLTFWQDSLVLRVASALVMGVAVCGTHYTGMAAATYTTNPDEDYGSSREYTLDGAQTSLVASHLSILLCYWFTSLVVTASVRGVEYTRSQGNESHGVSNARSTHALSTTSNMGASHSKIYVGGRDKSSAIQEP